MLERSQPGEVPTFHERDLLAHSDGPGISEAMAQWARLAQRVGLTAVLEIFDTFSGEKVSIPSRDSFFDALWCPQRDRIARRLLSEGKTRTEIARELGVSRQAIWAITSNVRADVEPADVVKGAR